MARDLIGEARTITLVDAALRRRIGRGIATKTMADQSSAIGRLFGGLTSVRRSTIRFEIAGAAGAAWIDGNDLTGVGTDFLMRQVACIGGGTTEMARNVVSERVLGMPRDADVGSGRGLPRRPAQRLAQLRSRPRTVSGWWGSRGRWRSTPGPASGW